MLDDVFKAEYHDEEEKRTSSYGPTLEDGHIVLTLHGSISQHTKSIYW